MKRAEEEGCIEETTGILQQNPILFRFVDIEAHLGSVIEEHADGAILAEGNEKGDRLIKAWKGIDVRRGIIGIPVDIGITALV